MATKRYRGEKTDPLTTPLQDNGAGPLGTLWGQACLMLSDEGLQAGCIRQGQARGTQKERFAIPEDLCLTQQREAYENRSPGQGHEAVAASDSISSTLLQRPQPTCFFPPHMSHQPGVLVFVFWNRTEKCINRRQNFKKEKCYHNSTSPRNQIFTSLSQIYL